MPLLGKVEVKTIELPDALEFIVSREESTAETIVFPALALILLVWFWNIGSLWPRILAAFSAAISAVAWIANRTQGGKTTLRVTTHALIADGNLGRLFSTHEEVGIEKLSSIRYIDAGGDGISGIFAVLGWRNVLLLPHVSADQANSIIADIRRKFPSMPAEHYSPTTLADLLPFGGGAQVTTLGLSNPVEEKSPETNQDSPS